MLKLFVILNAKRERIRNPLKRKTDCRAPIGARNDVWRRKQINAHLTAFATIRLYRLFLIPHYAFRIPHYLLFPFCLKSSNGTNGFGTGVCLPMNFSIHIISYHLPNLYPHFLNFPTVL